MRLNEGIIDNNNPFIHDDWIKQGFSFTLHRQNQISELFGKHIKIIL
jgi:hypothetical protein